MDDVVRLARKAVPEAADVGRRAAHVDHERVRELREKGGAAHAVRGAGLEREHRERLRDRRDRHGPVVLGQVEGRRDPASPQGGVEQRDVLPLEQPDPAELVRQRDRDVGTFVAHDLCGGDLARGIERREHRRDRHGADSGLANLPGGAPHGRDVERHDRAAVVLVSSLHHEDRPAHDRREIVGPVDERPERRAGWKADAYRRDRREVAALDDRVREMRRADHHGVDGSGRDA